MRHRGDWVGGILICGERVLGYFASSLTRLDESRFNSRIGDNEGQQIWEALCVLVALRAWIKQWAAVRVLLTSKPDNLSALVMAGKLKITSSTLIAREVALLLSEAAFMPRHIEHLPGVMNTWAGALSRLAEPGSNHAIPEQLRSAPRARCEPRSAAFYTTLATESQGGGRRVDGWFGWLLAGTRSYRTVIRTVPFQP